eukprot:TRINITY_DN75964_c0_g1_i1.p1 TRINITY_DN75964_c0_g1~~TRINITY_DN75964_c0_g1_i1.p1  ORF type:complete len:351 (-),score=57.26 TRINITY_DN75964_c0_g1_i1:241-1293(-)
MTTKFLCVTALAAVMSAAVDPLDLPVTRFPFLMAHDAATAYLTGDNPIYLFTRTQTGNFTTLLDAGVRAFDMRPRLHEGRVLMHHGAITIHVTYQSLLAEISRWATAAPSTAASLVIVYVSHCDVSLAVAEALAAQGIPNPAAGNVSLTAEQRALVSSMTSSLQADCDATVTNITASLLNQPVVDCEDLVPLTVSRALIRGKTTGGQGASVLSVVGCVNENYDSSIQCFPASSTSFKFTCYKDDATSVTPISRLYTYADGVAAKLPALDAFEMLQVHWQESESSVAHDLLHGSDLIQDEIRSDVNHRTTQAIAAGRFPHLGLVEVNNALNYGTQMQAALLAWVRNATHLR